LENQTKYHAKNGSIIYYFEKNLTWSISYSKVACHLWHKSKEEIIIL